MPLSPNQMRAFWTASSATGFSPEFKQGIRAKDLGASCRPSLQVIPETPAQGDKDGSSKWNSSSTSFAP